LGAGIETGVFSALAANRKQFFELIAAAERQFNCDIDERGLVAEIDSNYDGRNSLTVDEARDLLMKVSKPKKPGNATASPSGGSG
jgi:hypothetical protein